MHTLRAYTVHVTISFVICLDVVIRVFNLVVNQATWSVWQRRETMYKQSFRTPSFASLQSSVVLLVQSTILIFYPWMPGHFKEMKKVSCQIVPFIPLLFFFFSSNGWLNSIAFFLSVPVPIGSPRDLAIRITSATSAYATWTGVPDTRETIRGKLLGYKVRAPAMLSLIPCCSREHNTSTGGPAQNRKYAFQAALPFPPEQG